MKVYNDINNMVFDDADPRCIVRTCFGQRRNYAFVQCLDLGNPGNRLSVPGVKRYWGEWDADNPEESVKLIMKNGGKWPDLPDIEYFEEYKNLPYQE